MDQSDIWSPKWLRGGGTGLGLSPKFYHFFSASLMLFVYTLFIPGGKMLYYIANRHWSSYLPYESSYTPDNLSVFLATDVRAANKQPCWWKSMQVKRDNWLYFGNNFGSICNNFSFRLVREVTGVNVNMRVRHFLWCNWLIDKRVTNMMITIMKCDDYNGIRRKPRWESTPVEFIAGCLVSENGSLTSGNFLILIIVLMS